ncbi:MAG: iron-containing redox enzyme family protein [Bdellovibrionaceae bacterium]|nr:iron-containing redox enzyme family protein [Pseudobdellovibrionaceae bacterium]
MKSILNQEIEKIKNSYTLEHFRNKEFYTEWLAQTYFFVRHSTRLLNLSAALTPFELQFYHLRANEHAHEERSHEKLIDLDLKSFGTKIENFKELPSTKSFYQTQYYHIQHVHPLSFLGYVLVLETLAITLGKELVPIVEECHGKKTSAFLRLHAQEDIEHIDSLMKVFDALPRSLTELIAENLTQSAFLYRDIIKNISDEKLISNKKVA